MASDQRAGRVPVRHVVEGPYREKRWPHQWIAMCSCGDGIRCNSRADAEAFLRRQGCR